MNKEEFIKVWNDSNTVEEVCRYFDNWNSMNLSKKASMLRTNGVKMKYMYRDKEFYRKAGAKGGSISIGGGFANGEIGRELARTAGAKGGSISRRGKAQ